MYANNAYNNGVGVGVGVGRQSLATGGSPTSSNSSVFDSQLLGASHSVLAMGSSSVAEYKPYVLSNQAIAATGLAPGALCAICNDKATGKHYNAQSCDGCKGFFRRSVRKNQQYRCRFQRNCQIDKDKRNQCRYCRLSKCIQAGMRKDSVQNERDKIGSKSHPQQDELAAQPAALHNSFSLQVLHHAEMMSRKVCYELANSGADGTSSGGSAADEHNFVTTAMQSQRIATAIDIVDAMHRQLLVLVEWSKAIPCFMTELSMDDQIAMLRAHAGDHLLVGVTKRSIVLQDVLLLANGAIIPRNPATDSEIYRIANRVIDELVHPMQELKIDDNECACLKAIVFFDPSARGLSNSSRIRAWRHQVMLTLDDYVRERDYDSSVPVSTPAGRFGELMMLIPVLQNLSMLMVEQLQLIKLVGAAKLDSLLQEMLLGVVSVSGEATSSSSESMLSLTPQSQSQSQSQSSVAVQSAMMQSASRTTSGILSSGHQSLARATAMSGQTHSGLAANGLALSNSRSEASKAHDRLT